MPVSARDEHVRRSVVGLRRGGQLEIARHADDAVALAGAQSVADESAALRPPHVLHPSAEVVGDERSDLVLEALLLLVRVGEAVRVSADTEDARCGWQVARQRW